MKKLEEKGLTEYCRKNEKSLRLFLAAMLGFFTVCALPSTLSISGEGLFYTNSLLAFLLWLSTSCFLYRVFSHPFKGKKTRWLIPLLFALLLSIAMTFGAQLEAKESVSFTQGSLWLSILVLTVGMTLTVRFFWDRLSLWIDKKKAEEAKKQTVKSREKHTVNGKARLLPTAGVLFLCWFPVFLAVYPGFFVYDAQDELMQVITRNFSTHHPLIHVLLLGGIVQLGYKLSGSYNVGIACYTLFQMAALSVIFSFCICRMKGRTERILTTLYFGLFPVIVMFSLCSAKDGLFTGLLLVAVLLLRKLCKGPGDFFETKRNPLLLVMASTGMMLLRHNGFYALLVFAFLFFLFRKKAGLAGCGKRLLALFAGIFIGYGVINSGLAFFLQAADSGNQEMLTVPIQQLARVYQNQKDSLPQEEKEILYEVLPQEALENYTPKVSDQVKIHFNNGVYQENPFRYVRLWAKWGTSHPFTYLNGWFMTSYGFWYPDAVIDVYRGNSVFTYTYEDSSYFGYEVEEPGTRESKIPFLDELYRKLSLEVTQQKLPALSMLFSPGFLFWILAFMLGFFWYEKRYPVLLPYLLPLLVWLTVILGPTYLVRYVVFLWVILPFLLRDMVSGKASGAFDN